VSFAAYLRRSLFPLMCLSVIVYFAYHAVQGDNGLLAWYKLQSEARELEAELATVQAERRALEADVALMRPESLDPDMLDQRARETLNLAHPNDITILRRAR
jgi:cell division protein FtsB